MSYAESCPQIAQRPLTSAWFIVLQKLELLLCSRYACPWLNEVPRLRAGIHASHMVGKGSLYFPLGLGSFQNTRICTGRIRIKLAVHRAIPHPPKLWAAALPLLLKHVSSQVAGFPAGSHRSITTWTHQLILQQDSGNNF